MVHNKLNYQFCFKSYGVLVRLESNSREVLDQAIATARKALLGQAEEIDCGLAEQVFSFLISADGACSIIQNGQTMVTSETEIRFWKYFDSLVRILVAEFTKERIFL